MTGTEIIMECLLEQGVDTVFGYPGGAILNLYDELYRYQDRVTHVLTAHEQGAAHAADGYARSTGKVGVCFATSGPGATNLVTGIATAMMDSSPVVFITCNVTENLIGTDAFQEINISGVSMPITKNNYYIHDINDLAPSIREAFTIARSGRPGPVLIDITKDVTAPSNATEFMPMTKEEYVEKLKESPVAERPIFSGVKENDPCEEGVEILLSLLEESKKPLILMGGGVIRAHAAKDLFQFATKADIPVASTLMGLGGFPADHPLFTGLTGMHGTKRSNWAISNCDLLIAFGSRFNDRVTCNSKEFGKHCKVVHVDIDRAEIDKNVLTTHSIVCDVKVVLTGLNEKLTHALSHEEWKKDVMKVGTIDIKERPDHWTPRDIINVIEEETKGEAIVTTDVGQHQMWAAQFFHFDKPNRFITSGGFGTMGFGLGAAIGSKLGNPERTVVHITGDGSFKMNCNELSTVSSYEIPIVTVLFNNHTLGMVRQWQNLMYDKRFYQTTLSKNPDFAALAKAYGIAGYTTGDLDTFRESLRKALASKKAAVIVCDIDMDEMVTPMVPPGNELTEYLLD